MLLATVVLGALLAYGEAVAQGPVRQTVSIDDRVPTSQEVEAALFPKNIQAIKAECARVELAGMRCQSVIPKSAMGSVLVTFSRGSAELSGEALAFLSTVGDALQRRASSWTSVLIEGHTDATGSREVNERLSLARAEAVKSYLQANYGLKNIEAVGRASDQLKDTADPGAAVNRRIEFIPEW